MRTSFLFHKFLSSSYFVFKNGKRYIYEKKDLQYKTKINSRSNTSSRVSVITIEMFHGAKRNFKVQQKR